MKFIYSFFVVFASLIVNVNMAAADNIELSKYVGTYEGQALIAKEIWSDRYDQPEGLQRRTLSLCQKLVVQVSLHTSQYGIAYLEVKTECASGIDKDFVSESTFEKENLVQGAIDRFTDKRGVNEGESYLDNILQFTSPNSSLSGLDLSLKTVNEDKDSATTISGYLIKK